MKDCSTSSRWTMLRTVIVLLAVCCQVAADCSPVEEGQSTSLSCPVNKGSCSDSDSLVTWFAAFTVIPLIRCRATTCGGSYFSEFPTTITGPEQGSDRYTSTLTIPSASRTDPDIDIETRWSCVPCSGGEEIVCDKLEVFAKPLNPTCTMTANPDLANIASVSITCSTTKVYPEAKCVVYRSTDGGDPVDINIDSTYSHPEFGGTPVYYSSTCSVSVPVSDLGVGTHSFQGRIYPGVTGGEDLVDTTAASGAVTLVLPESSHTCTTEVKDGYFRGRSASCTCSLTSDGRPKGMALWYKGSQIVQQGLTGTASLTFDRNNPSQVYGCKGVSDLGQTQGSSLTASFAFFDDNAVTVTLQPPKTTFDLCGNNPVQVTCRVSKDEVNPVPRFSFSLDGVTYGPPQIGNESPDGSFYERKFSPSPEEGGLFQIWCRVTNSIYTDMRQEKNFPSTVFFRKPPPLPPKIVIDGRTYQGTSTENVVTLAEGHTGTVRCSILGGYPLAHNTALTCATFDVTRVNDSATLFFGSGQLTRAMDETVCSYTAQHDSGCYTDRETTVTLDVTYAPSVSLILASAHSMFSTGDTPTITCSAQGNPSPSVSLARQSTGVELASVRGNSKRAELTHQLDPLGCLDTDVYVCTGRNGRTTRDRTAINVQCPQQLKIPVNGTQSVEAAIVAMFSFGVYGYPPPISVTLRRPSDNTSLAGTSRHRVVYSPSDPPTGSVDLTIYDVVKDDFGTYSITVDNGVGDALVYTLELHQSEGATVEGQEDQSDGADAMRVVAITVGLIAAVIIAALVVVIVILVRRIKRQEQAKDTQKPAADEYLYPTQAVSNSNNGGYLVPLDEVSNRGERDPLPNPTPAPSQYETIQYHDLTFNPGSGAMPLVPSLGLGHYDTVPDRGLTSEPYNVTSEQNVDPPNTYRRMALAGSAPGNARKAKQPENYVNVDGKTLGENDRGNRGSSTFERQQYENFSPIANSHM